VGACNEDVREDQWEDRKTHNSALSYAAMTAKSLNADYQNISVSGIGIITGYEPHSAPAIWNRMTYDPKAPLADLSLWQPEILFLNYGENDDSYTSKQNIPFPADYTSEYIKMVKAMRAAYPQSHIVLLRGGMFGGAKSERLRGPWKKVREALMKTDPKIHFYVFGHWSTHHPRVADHKKMAAELVSWIKKNNLIR
jgi:hypothetical protein